MCDLFSVKLVNFYIKMFVGGREDFLVRVNEKKNWRCFVCVMSYWKSMSFSIFKKKLY